MKAFNTTLLVQPALRIAVFAAMGLGFVTTSPASGQEVERGRMVALDQQVTSSTPPALEHSQRATLAAGTELLIDGGFEGGLHGGSEYGSAGTAGSWGWWNGEMTSDGSIRYADALSPIWHNSGGVNARTGQYMAYFNPFGPAASKLYQTILIPAGNTATLSFWLKIGVTSSSSSSDNLFVCFEDYSTKVDLGCPGVYSPADASGYSWVYHSYDVSRFAGKSVTLFFQSQVVASTVFQTDDVSVTTGSTTPPSSAACTETTSTMCLVGGRYRVTSYWKNQYAGGALSNLSKTTLTDATGAFWNANANAYEYFIRINTATDNGHAWIAISTLTDVEFFVVVYDTKTAQSFQYHSPAGNRTLIYDPSTFVYP